MNFVNPPPPPWFLPAEHNGCDYSLKQFFENLSKCDFSTVSPTNIDSQLIKSEFGYELIIAIIFFIFMLVALYKAWMQTRLPVEMEDKKVIHLRKFTNFKVYLQRPKLLPTIIISSGLISFFIFGDFLFNYFIGKSEISSLSNLIAVAIAATSVLFPLVILIMDASKRERSGIFPTSEILLKYAYAFPISILLLVVLIMSALEMNYYWMRCIAIIAVLASGMALLRLLNIIFGPKEWKVTENELLQMQVADSVAVIAYQRAGMAKTSKLMKGLSAHVKLLFDMSTHRKNGFSDKIIKSNKTGMLTKIDISVVEQVIRSLLPEDKFSSNENSESVTETSIKDSEDFKIIIMVLEKEIIENPDTVICTFRYNKSKIDDSKASQIVEKLSKAFKIDQATDANFSSEQLDLILLRIKKLGQDAITEDSEILSESVSEAYVTLTKSLIDAFDNLNIKYTLENIKNETPLYGMDWKPLTGMFENINDWTERFLQSSNENRHIRDNIIWLPYRLCLISFSKREILIFSNSINVVMRQQWASENKKNLSLPWIKSLLEHYLGAELEKKYDDEEEVRVVFNFLKLVFKNVMLLIKDNLECGDEQSFHDTFNLIWVTPSLFRYEDIEEELKMKEYCLRFYNEENKRLAEVEIGILKHKMSIVQKVSNWRMEISVGLATYCLMLLDDKGNPDFIKDESFLQKCFQECINKLPISFEEVVKLRVRINHFDLSERWGFESWEYIPLGEARFMEFGYYKNKVFGYLLLRAYQLNISNIDWSKLSFFETDTFDFRNEPNTLRGIIPTLNLDSSKFNIPKRTNTELEEIDSCFDSLIFTAKLNTQLRVAKSGVSEERVQIFKEEFTSTFEKNNRVRKIINTNIQKTNKKHNQWGLNIVVDKECFIQDERFRYPNLGSDYGHGIARDEEGFFFEELSKNADISKSKFASDLVKEAVRNGTDVESIVLFASQDLYLSKIFQADLAFKHEHQVKQHKWKGVADAYIEFDNEVLVPIIKIFARTKGTKKLPSLILISTKDVSIDIFVSEKDGEILQEIGFSFSLVNPLESSENAKTIREHFSKTKPAWLEEVPSEHREELMGLKLWLKVLQKIQVTTKKRPLAIYSNEKYE